MLFKQSVLERVATGEVKLAFRRWLRPTVKAGGRLRTVIGVLSVIAVDEVDPTKLSMKDAELAGYESLDRLKADLKPRGNARDAGAVYRISFALDGPDPRISLRNSKTMDDSDFEEIRRLLSRCDKSSKKGPWTTNVLLLISRHPETRAAELANRTGLEKEWLKSQIRKLKELGLTESLLPGYKLSPRGTEFLRHLKKRRLIDYESPSFER